MSAGTRRFAPPPIHREETCKGAPRPRRDARIHPSWRLRASVPAWDLLPVSCRAGGTRQTLSLTVRRQKKRHNETQSAGESRSGEEMPRRKPLTARCGPSWTLGGRPRKRAREGPLSVFDREAGGLDAQARRGERGQQAETQQEDGGDPVEVTFELRERHDTHLRLALGNPGGAGPSVWTTDR